VKGELSRPPAAAAAGDDDGADEDARQSCCWFVSLGERPLTASRSRRAAAASTGDSGRV